MTEVLEKPLVFIRASSLSTLFDCAHRWEAEHLLGIRKARGAAAQLGTAVHAGTALFDAARLPGAAALTADDAADAVVKAINEPGEDVDWTDLAPRKAEKIALALHTKYCHDVAPRQTYLGVEVTCEKLELPELGLALTGTTDRIRIAENGRYGIVDLKTGKRAVGADGKAEVKKHAIQLGVYELLAEHASGVAIGAPAQVVGMNTGDTASTQRIGFGEVRNARAALVGSDDAPGFLGQAARIVQSGDFPANPNSWLCSAKFCSRWSSCRFHR